PLEGFRVEPVGDAEHDTAQTRCKARSQIRDIARHLGGDMGDTEVEMIEQREQPRCGRQVLFKRQSRLLRNKPWTKTDLSLSNPRPPGRPPQEEIPFGAPDRRDCTGQSWPDRTGGRSRRCAFWWSRTTVISLPW